MHNYQSLDRRHLDLSPPLDHLESSMPPTSSPHTAPTGQEKGTSEEHLASLLPLGITTLGITNMAAIFFLKIFFTSLFKDSIMKTDFEIYAHATFSNGLYAQMDKNTQMLLLHQEQEESHWNCESRGQHQGGQSENKREIWVMGKGAPTQSSTRRAVRSGKHMGTTRTVRLQSSATQCLESLQA